MTTPAAPPSHGLILFAHGSRDARWAEPFEVLVATMRARAPGCAVRLAYLELMAPDLGAAAAELVQAGCRRIDVLPLFLGVGQHLRNDLPPRLATIEAAHPGVDFRLQPALGELASFHEAVAGIALDMLHR